jgi:hypothetical protein
LFYLYPLFRVENRVCLSRGVQVAGAAWRVETRIMAGVGDLVQRTGDGRTGWVFGGRTIWRSGDVMDHLFQNQVPMPKQSTHHMHDPGSIVPHIWPKVFTDSQMSQIKYNYYSGRLHNSTGTTTRATRSLELLVKEFQSIFSF